MRKPLLVAALLASACGVETDDRPATAEYISTAITRPACASAACHSAATARKGYIFETALDLCKSTIDRNGIAGQVSPGAANRMPLDAPLPQADIDLIKAWEAPLHFEFPDTQAPEGCPPLPPL